MSKELVAEALKALARSYAPYSKHQVGAALEGRSGEIYIGTNVENASLGLTVCAERVAICSAVAAGEQHFERLAIVTSRGKATPPCGACRQVIAEFAPDIEIHMVARNRTQKIKLTEIYPKAFRLR